MKQDNMNFDFEFFCNGEGMFMTAAHLCECLAVSSSTFDALISRNPKLNTQKFSAPCEMQGADGKMYRYCNEVNQKFVDIVRNSGGNNAKRHLLISGYNTAVDLTCDPLFRMPNDPAGRCAVSVHYYIPSTFAILEKDAEWGSSAYTWGSNAELAELNKNMDLLKSTFVDRGVPVIIGEYGCPTNNKEAASVRRYLSAVCEQALKRGGICPVLWDITNLHYNRSTCQLSDRTLHDNFVSYGAAYTEKLPDDVPETGNEDAVIIRNLTVFDQSNAADWSVVTAGAEVGSRLFGDRDLTITALPENLVGAEMIRTACDSKLQTTDLGSFTAGSDATIYAAVDTRVTGTLPAWLKAWTYAGGSVSTSNGLTLALYKLQVSTGEVIALGTNGGSNESVNYIVMAVPRESVIKGDINPDGTINAIDLAMAKAGLNSTWTNTCAFDAADIDADEKHEQDDIHQLKAFLMNKQPKFTSDAPVKPKSSVPVKPEEPTFEYDANLQYHAPPSSYKTDCSQQGKIEQITYQTSVHSSALTKSAYVYLPAAMTARRNIISCM